MNHHIDTAFLTWAFAVAASAAAVAVMLVSPSISYAGERSTISPPSAQPHEHSALQYNVDSAP